MLIARQNCRCSKRGTNSHGALVRVGHLLSIAGVTVAALGAGCNRGDGPERVVVAGAVAYQGEPVSQGLIRFTPVKGTTGPITVAKIVNGKYTVNANGGVPVGSQAVEISGYRPDPKYASRSAPGPVRDWPPRQQYLPVKYNAKTELEIRIESGRGKIVKDYDLGP